MKAGDIVAANIEGVCFENNAVGEVLKICGGAMPNVAVVRFTNGWRVVRDQLVGMASLRVIPKL